MKRHLRLVCDMPLLIQGVIVSLLTPIFCIGAVLLIGHDGVAASETEALKMQIIFVVLLVVFLIAMISVSSRILCIVTFSADSIEYWRPFSQLVKYKYSYFSYIYRIGYLHGRLYRKEYILFSSIKLLPEALNQANRIHTSDKMVKIRYSKRTYQRLMAILPATYCSKLERVFSK